MEFKICRVCLARTATLSVFDRQGDVQYCTKIMKCASVVITEGDGLPDSICEGCSSDLAACYEFAARCEASDRALRALDRLHSTPVSPAYKECLPDPVKQEIKPENDLPDESHFFETYLEDCFGIDYTNNDSINDNKKVKKTEKKKSKIYSNGIKVGKYEYKFSLKVLPKHMRKRKIRLKTGPIQCLLCNRTLSCHSAFELHMRSHTKEKPYTCDVCKKTFSTKHIMKIHILRHFGIKESRKKKACLDNDKRCNRPKQAPLQCTICGRMSASRSAMEDHMRTHTGEKPFTCELCGKKYRIKGTLQRHMHTSHPDSHPGAQFICEHCGKVFYARTNIITHMRVHTGAKPYQCSYCFEKFRQISSMIRHRRLHTGEKPFVCSTCGRRFRDNSSFNKHKSVHSTEKMFTCHVCMKHYKTKESLRCHILRHTKEKPWVCSYCGLRVTSKGNLKTHTERMHSERSGICTVCNKQYSDVEVHMRAHTGERPFRCKICEQSYATARSLSHHMSFKHRNAGKFKCALEDCIRSFPTASMLEFHVLKAHTQTTPYVCTYCSRGFMRPSDLSRHLKLNHSDAHTRVKSHYLKTDVP